MLVSLEYLNGRGMLVALRLVLFGCTEVPALFLSHRSDTIHIH